jgi:hypothetical protein
MEVVIVYDKMAKKSGDIMRKTIVMGITTLIAAFMMSGCTMTKMGVAYMGFPTVAQDAYADMMAKLSETGDPGQAMMREWLITDEDLTEEDIFAELESLAGDYNMRFVGEKNMFRLTEAENPTPEKVVHARIGEFCSLSIAKRMLNHSRFYGGFMPCRIIYVEYGDGRRYLVSMDMTLALYGGTDKKPIDPKLMDQMKAVKVAMEAIPLKAAGYDTQKEADKAMAEAYAARGIK